METGYSGFIKILSQLNSLQPYKKDVTSLQFSFLSNVR